MLGNFELRRLLQGGVDPAGAGSSRPRASASTRSGSGSRSSRATRSSASAPTRRRSRSGGAVGVPDERIVRLPRSDNFWQAGPTGPCGPCSELYLDRGARVRRRRRAARRRHRPLPRVLEPRLHAVRPAPRTARSTAAAEAQHRHRPGPRPDGGDPPGRPLGVRDRPVPAAGRARRGALRARATATDAGDDAGAAGRSPTTSRGAAFLIADGVVPSNEDRGYILRRIMRRAIQQGRALGLEPPFLGRFAERAIELMGDAYPELRGRARDDRRAGSPTRRRASAARSSRAPSCSSELIERARRSRAPPGSTPRTPSSCTTPTASPTT